MTSTKEKSSKYWYLFTHFVCPLCGREGVYKERIYTIKPKDYWQRHIVNEAWDYCNW